MTGSSHALLLSALATVLGGALSLGQTGKSPAAGQAMASPPVITVERSTEEGKPVLVGKVTVAGKPVGGATLAVFVERTFGAIRLGQDTTLDDGTVAVPFPMGLPGSPEGWLRVRVEIVEPAVYAGLRTVVALRLEARDLQRLASARLPRRGPPESFQRQGSRRLDEPGTTEDPFPRTIWGPRAPVSLLLALLGLLGAVWFTYAFVLTQLIHIRKGD